MLAYATRLLVVGLAMVVLTPDGAWAQQTAGAEVALSRGISSFMAEDYDAARRQFEAALAYDPDFAAAHYFLGLTLLQAASDAPTSAAERAMLERAIAEFNQSRLRDPDMVLAFLDAAIAQTILGRFGDAESGFQQFIEQRPDDPMPYLFLAVVYYRQAKDQPENLPQAEENLDQAEAALERSGKPDRSVEATIKFYRALIALQRENWDEARTALEEGYELAPESEIGKQSKELLDQLVERRPWELAIQLGFDWDSNVILRGHDVITRKGDQKPDDWRFGLASAFTYRLVDTEEFVLGVGGTTFNTWHTEIDEFDVQSYGANVYAGYSPKQADWLTLSLRYDWDYSFVGNDSFLARHRLTPQIDIQEADWTGTTLFYQFDVRDYHHQSTDPRLDRDGHTHAFGVVQHFDLLEMFERQLTTSLSYRFENVQTEGTEFAADNHIFALGVGVPLPHDFSFDFLSEFEVDFYKHGSRFDLDGSKRRDFI
ncbi:MAG TPA: tetratricopeptide repeat protein, partial [Phycisphaerae bacterium]|nr:tetratricopeptide repeat protein [Phycisphaerae bacterium]